jgi:2-(1,2-epoxy-1,2-dihydrophenyl)acetyl-CoA isomerase
VSAVLSSVADGVAHLELNTPECLNALGLRLCEELKLHVESASDDPLVKVLVVTGRGRAFSAGGDLKSMVASHDRAGLAREIADAAHACVLTLDALAKPVVVAVHGVVAGAAIGLATAADVLLAGRSTRFLAAYPGIGLTPDCGLSWTLPRLLGQARSLEFLLLGEELSAERAQEWGLVARVCDDQSVQAQGLSLARQLADGPAQALGLTRRLVRRSREHDLDQHLYLEAATVVQQIGSDEARTRINRFGER